MTKIRVGVLILSAVAAAGPAQGQLPRMLEQAVRVAEHPQFELAGVKIGMTPAEVASVMAAAGYRPNQGGNGPSWETSISTLARERSIRLPAGGEVPSWQDFRKGAEYLNVDYRPTPTGAVVREVYYTVTSAALPRERFREALTRRYGRPGWHNEVEFIYCSRGEPTCNPIERLQLPSVYADIGPMQHSIRLRGGTRIWAAHEAALRAEVDRRAPQMARPTF